MKNALILEAGLNFCQRHIEDSSISDHPRQQWIKEVACCSGEYSVTSFKCDQFKYTQTVGKSGGSDRDWSVFHEFGGVCNVYLPG